MDIEKLAREVSKYGTSGHIYKLYQRQPRLLQQFANAVLEDAAVKLESADAILNLPSVPQFSGDERPTEKRVLRANVAAIRSMKKE